MRLSVGIEDARDLIADLEAGSRPRSRGDPAASPPQHRPEVGPSTSLSAATARVSLVRVESIRRPLVLGGRASCSSESAPSIPLLAPKGLRDRHRQRPRPEPAAGRARRRSPTADRRHPRARGEPGDRADHAAPGRCHTAPPPGALHRAARRAHGPRSLHDRPLPAGLPGAGGGLPDHGGSDPADPHGHDDRLRARSADRGSAERQGRPPHPAARGHRPARRRQRRRPPWRRPSTC